MAKSHTSPAPSIFFVLTCLCVMLITSIRIWHQATDMTGILAVNHAEPESLAGSSPVESPLAGSPIATLSPALNPSVQRYGAEIRAEAVLADTPGKVDLQIQPKNTDVMVAQRNGQGAHVSPLPSGLPSIEFNSEVKPETIDVPIELSPSPPVAIHPAIAAPVLPPLQTEPVADGNLAIPVPEQVAGNGARTTPIITPPSAVSMPRSPVDISFDRVAPIETPKPIEPVKPIEPLTTLAETTGPANVALESLPLPPPLQITSTDDDAPDGNQQNAMEDPGPAALTLTPPENVPFVDPVTVPVIEPAPIELPQAALAASEPENVTIENDPPNDVENDSDKIATTDITEEPAAEGPSVGDALAEARRKAKSKKTDRRSAKEPPSDWPQPKALLQQLQELQELEAVAGTSEIVNWAKRIEAELANLRRTQGLNTFDTREPLTKLRTLIEHTPRINNSSIQSKVMVARYALQRRWSVYLGVQTAMKPELSKRIDAIQKSVDDDAVVQSTRNIRRQLGTGKSAEEWSRFLLLDSVDGLASSATSRGGAERVMVATELLQRMNREEMNQIQRSIVASPAARQLQNQLRKWCTVKNDHPAFLKSIEKFEVQGNFLAGNQLSDDSVRMRWSLIPEHNQLASTFFSHYRNANARIAVTENLLNRMLPIVRDSDMPIRDQVLGARVFGNSASWTKIAIDLLPDKQRLRANLIANGSVNANTRSYKGPAVVINRNQSQFYLRKTITADANAIHIGKSSTTASTKLNVLGLGTKYDGVPLIGSIARRKAQQQVDEQRNLVRRIINRRVASQAQTQVDTQLTQQLLGAQNQLDKNFVQPLRRMQLDPTTINMETTQNRAVWRGRLAAQHHLAAYTPRPNALANSLASLQMHESVINNALERFQIDGRRGDMREMLEQIAKRQTSINFEVPDEVPEGVSLAFADKDAVNVHWQDGVMQIKLQLAEIAYKRKSWKNFVVSTTYRPKTNGIKVEFFRDGGIEVASKRRLSTRDRVALTGIFGKVFSKNRSIPMVPDSLSQDRRLADLQITQFQIRDGWIGISLGQKPRNVARQRGNFRR